MRGRIIQRIIQRTLLIGIVRRRSRAGRRAIQVGRGRRDYVGRLWRGETSVKAIRRSMAIKKTGRIEIREMRTGVRTITGMAGRRHGVRVGMGHRRNMTARM